MAIQVDPVENEKYEDAMARAKYMILDRVTDHGIQHISKKNTAKEMWDTLTTLYRGTSM